MRKTLLALLALFGAVGGADAAVTKPLVLPPWADTGIPTTDVVQPSNGFISAGWLNSATPPSRQYFNWVLNYATNGVRYLTRRSIADWDTLDTYSQGDVVQVGNVLYQSSVNSNTANTPTSVSLVWQPINTKTAPNGDHSLSVATTAFVFNNYIPIGGPFSSLGGQIAAGQVPVGAITQWQGSLAINWGQISGVPSAMAPTPNTLCLRDSSGFIYGNYLNQASQNNESTPISQVMVTNGTDGFFRKANFIAFQNTEQLPNIGGAVTPGQVPVGAVTQYSPQIFNFNPSQSQGSPGYTTIPGGIVIEWGAVTLGDVVSPVTGTVTFPKAFHAVFNITVSVQDTSNGGATTVIASVGPSNTTSFIWAAREFVTAVQNETVLWTAIGN